MFGDLEVKSEAIKPPEVEDMDREMDRDDEEDMFGDLEQ